MMINKIQLKKGGYASILGGVVTPDRSDKWKYLVSAQLSLNEYISLIFLYGT